MRIQPDNDVRPRRSESGMRAAGGGDTEAFELHFLDYVRVLYKRRWTACTTLVVVMVAFTVYALTVTPVYEATTRLIIEGDRQNVVAFKAVVEDEQQPTDTYYQTQFKLLESRALAERTIDALHLWNDPELCESCGSGRPGVRSAIDAAGRAVVSSALRAFGSPSPQIETAPRTGASPLVEAARKSRAVDRFVEKLTVAPVRSSRLVDVRFRAPDPALAARVVNTLTRGYIETNVDVKFLASQQASDWLAKQLAEQLQQVEESESALQQYREQHDAVAVEDRQNIVVQKLADLNAAVTKAKTERIEKESLHRQLEGTGYDWALLDSFPVIQSSTFVQQLKAQLADLQRRRAQLSSSLGDKHPDIVAVTTAIENTEAKLQGEIAKVMRSVENAYLAARAQERSLVSALDAQKSEALAMNRKGIEASMLQREAESNRQLYQSLMQRAKETGVSRDLKTSSVRIIDLADVPSLPINPSRKKPLDFLMAFGAGALLGIMLAFLFEYLDDRIKTPDQIASRLGLPTLGLVPRITSALLGPNPLLSKGVPLNFAEAFRTLRTSVLFSVADCADAGARKILVTSTSPGEGKTLSASNLAVGLAMAGQRVLLIDADMRRPRVHEMFGIEQKPGLSNLLVGNVSAKEAMRPTGVAGLVALPAGQIPPNPSELLASQRFQDCFEALGEHFDWVIVDSPPALAVTDSSLIAHLTHGILFVIGSEMTSHRAAATALDRLERANGRFIGGVLNRVNLDRDPYYYSQYYRREYGDYYIKDPLPATASGHS